MAVRKRHRTVSAAAPVGGLNVRDPINGMPGTDAIDLINWVPQQYGVRCRKGWKEWATNLGAPVQSLAAFQPDREVAANYRLFAFTDTDIFDVSSSTDAPVSVETLGGGTNEGRYTTVMLTNIAGSFLLGCSHNGGYGYYDGTNWVTPTFGVGVGQVSGVNPADLVFVTTWKRRTWFIEKNSTSAWYSDIDAITGPMTELPLGPFVKRGGKLAFISSWTIDAGEGIDDLIVFAFENGDILIYKGTDPDDASAFALVGAYYVGAIPVGRRCFSHFGGDLLVMSELGIQPLSYVTRGGQSLLRASSVDYLGKVQPRFADLVAASSDTLGWDMILYPRENYLIVNKPVGSDGIDEQYSMYTNTSAWTTFRNMPMRCFAVANSDFYFGTEDGRVCLGFSGFFDEVLYGETAGDGIVGMIQPSFSYYGALGAYKQFLMARPTFLAADRPSVSCDMLADYVYRPPSSGSGYALPEGALWDISLWDASVWGGALNVYDDWFSVEALGYTGAPFINTTTVGDTFLAAIDVMFEVGGPL